MLHPPNGECHFIETISGKKSMSSCYGYRHINLQARYIDVKTFGFIRRKVEKRVEG